MRTTMWNRNVCYDPNGGPAGAPQQQQQQAPAKEEPKGMDRFLNMWDPPKPKDPPVNNPNPPNNNNPQPNNQEPGAGLKAHLAKQNYLEGVDMTPMTEAFKNGDVAA